MYSTYYVIISIMFEDINSIYDMIDVKYDFDVTTMLSKLIMHEHHIQPLIVPGLFVTHTNKPSIIIYDHDAISYNVNCIHSCTVPTAVLAKFCEKYYVSFQLFDSQTK